MREGGCGNCITFLPLPTMKEWAENNQQVGRFGEKSMILDGKSPETYPYYRMSTYEIYGSEGYETLCDMFLKYYAEKVPVCIAFSGRDLNHDGPVAIWLVGKETFDPKTKQIPNSEPVGDILWCSNWPGENDFEAISEGREANK